MGAQVSGNPHAMERKDFGSERHRWNFAPKTESGQTSGHYLHLQYFDIQARFTWIQLDPASGAHISPARAVHGNDAVIEVGSTQPAMEHHGHDTPSPRVRSPSRTSGADCAELRNQSQHFRDVVLQPQMARGHALRRNSRRSYLTSALLLALAAVLGTPAEGLGAQPEQAPSKTVLVAPIEGMIDLGLAPFVARVLEAAQTEGAAYVILEVNTHGGLARGLDAGTAYEILSIDIADVDVGENIGAKLQIDQANADKQIAQAKAEERRAMAVAQEQEMRARVVEAEAEVPRAMAEAFRQGHLGIMDYYRMQNLQADTGMRRSIGTTDDPGSTKG
jgi:hypothetical protein